MLSLQIVLLFFRSKYINYGNYIILLDMNTEAKSVAGDSSLHCINQSDSSISDSIILLYIHVLLEPIVLLLWCNIVADV